MKKKSLIMMLVSMSLVAVIGVGATLAYLSDSTKALENTFVVGSDINIDLAETALDGTTVIIADAATTAPLGVQYKDLQPGDTIAKDPYVIVKKDSTDCYVFVSVKGLDNLESIDTDGISGLPSDFSIVDIDNANWEKVRDLDTAPNVPATINTPTLKDGIYQYQISATAPEVNNVIVKPTADLPLNPLFTQITYNTSATEPSALINSAKITVKACAVQAANLNDTTALAQAKFQ